jgi:O-antigen ligase
LNSILKDQITFTNLSVYVLAAAIVLMFTAPLYTPITIAGWIFISLVAAIIKRDKVKFKLELVLLSSLFLIYVLGIFWSANKAAAYFDLEVKMSLIIVPVVISLVGYHLEHLKKIIYSLLLALFVGMFAMFFQAIGKLLDGGGMTALFYTELSPYVHPAYFSYYLNIAGSLLLIDLITKKLQLFSFRWIYAALIIIFGIGSVFLLAKIGIVTLILVLIGLSIYWIKSGKIWSAVFLAVFSFSFSYGVYHSSDYVQGRVTEFVEAVGDGPKDHYIYSTTLRIEVWKAGLEKLVESPIIGYGTGDVGDVLYQRYVEKKIRRAPELRLNAHNQFLQTALATGVFGLFVISVLILLPIYKRRENFYFGMGLSIVTGLFFMTESVLETQAGVVGFTIFYCLLNSISLVFRRTDEKKVVLNNEIEE